MNFYEELRENHNISDKEIEEIRKNKKNTKMYYGKLEVLFEEICKAKNIDKKELTQQMIKNFVENNKEHVSEKYYLKYYGDKDEILIYGDDGKYYELSDGSKINKRTFEKMFKNNKTGEIEVNPYDFFNYNAINVKTIKTPEKPVEPVSPKDFNQSYEKFAETIKSFFDKIDTRNMKYDDEKTSARIIKPIYNNEPKKHNQSEDWMKMKKRKDKINEELDKEKLINKWRKENQHRYGKKED